MQRLQERGSTFGVGGTGFGRRGIYISILLIAALGSSTGFVINELTGIASNFIRAIFIFITAFELGAAWLIHRRRIPLEVMDEVLYLVPGGSLLGVLYFALYYPASVDQSQSALLGFYLWAPAIYVLIFLTHATRGALLRSVGFYAATVSLTLPAWSSSSAATAPRLFEQLYFSSAVVIVLLTFVSNLKSRLEQARTEARTMQKMAYTDALTGLHNRRRGEEILRAQAEAAGREVSELSVVLIDIDDFKRLNDEHGHDFGDLVIGEFARVVAAGLRHSDELARWGGEEFLIVAPDAAGEEAVRLAERVREAIQAHEFGEERISASFGVASLRKGESYSDLVRRADLSLYRAKAAGKNRVEA